MQTMSAHVFAYYRFLFSYDPETGLMTRIRVPTKHDGYVDCNYVVRSGNGKGYLTVRVRGHNRLVHRMAWEMHYDEDAPETIDHINRCKADNRIENMRAATLSGNAQNRLNPLRQSCPYRGVFYDRLEKTFRASISLKGRPISLGRHDCPEVLAQRYNRAAVELHGEFAILNVIGGTYAE